MVDNDFIGHLIEVDDVFQLLKRSFIPLRIPVHIAILNRELGQPFEAIKAVNDLGPMGVVYAKQLSHQHEVAPSPRTKLRYMTRDAEGAAQSI